MVMHLKSCCCGCTLKTGTVIIAVLYAIGSLIGLVGNIMMASAASGEAQKEIMKITPAEIRDQMPDNTTHNKGLEVIHIIYAIVSAIQLIVSIVLVFGASSERAHLVKPWIIYSIISTVIGSILQFAACIMILAVGLTMIGVLYLVFMAIGITIAVYFILVVNSFHTELISSNFPNKV